VTDSDESAPAFVWDFLGPALGALRVGVAVVSFLVRSSARAC